MRISFLGVLFCLISAIGPVRAQVFDMKFEQFRKALDKRITDDTNDKSGAAVSTIRQCKKVADTYTCSFNDKGFQTTVANLKKLDLLNGRFS